MPLSEEAKPATPERPPAPVLSVLVVNYNAGDLLSEAVTAVLANALPLEIIVSDNGSADGSLEKLEARHGDDPRLWVLHNGANLGFAGGHNRALPLTRAPYLLFLNPDCIVGPESLTRLIDFMAATPDAGMAGTIVRNPDGSEQQASRRRIPDPWVGLVRFLHLDRLWPNLLAGKRLNLMHAPLPTRPLMVDAISGSLMLVRRRALEEVGPLDEGYFLHCEDLDWFVRFRNAGWPIYLVPTAEVRHHQGACGLDRPFAVEWHKHKGMARFFRKFQFRDYPLPFSLLILLGIWVHFAVFSLLEGGRRFLRLPRQG